MNPQLPEYQHVKQNRYGIMHQPNTLFLGEQKMLNPPLTPRLELGTPLGTEERFNTDGYIITGNSTAYKKPLA